MSATSIVDQSEDGAVDCPLDTELLECKLEMMELSITVFEEMRVQEMIRKFLGWLWRGPLPAEGWTMPSPDRATVMRIE